MPDFGHVMRGIVFAYQYATCLDPPRIGANSQQCFNDASRNVNSKSSVSGAKNNITGLQA